MDNLQNIIKILRNKGYIPQKTKCKLHRVNTNILKKGYFHNLHIVLYNQKQQVKAEIRVLIYDVNYPNRTYVVKYFKDKKIISFDIM